MNFFIILFCYFISLATTEMPFWSYRAPRDKILFCLFEPSGSEVIYDNFTASHMIAQKALSDHT